MPFTVSELVPMMIQLRDVCLGIIELAHPDARPTVNEDYKIALKRTGVRTSNNNTKENHKKTMQWGHLFKVGDTWVRVVPEFRILTLTLHRLFLKTGYNWV